MRSLLKAILIASTTHLLLSNAALANQKSQTSMLTSWYGPGFHGRKTANGERFNMNDLTAAHRTLPFGTCLQLSNPVNKREVTVRVNDRGPFHGARKLDVSKAAAEALKFTEVGVTTLTVRVVNNCDS